MNYAVVIIDMTNDFVFGKLGTKGSSTVISPLQKLISFVHKKKIPIIYVSDAHDRNEPEMKAGKKYSIKGTKGAQIISELKPSLQDYCLEKRTYSGFFQTSLNSLLHRLQITNVIITGLETDICIQYTAVDAFKNGYYITVPKETTKAAREKAYWNGLNYLKTRYGANICRLDDLLDQISNKIHV